MKKIGFIFVTIFFLSCVQAYAIGMTLKEYKKFKKDNVMVIYVGAMGEGLTWANSALTHKGQSRLYCAPPNLDMSANGFMAILDGYLEKNPDMNKEDFFVGGLLLKALEYTFPCPK